MNEHINEIYYKMQLTINFKIQHFIKFFFFFNFKTIALDFNTIMDICMCARGRHWVRWSKESENVLSSL